MQIIDKSVYTFSKDNPPVCNARPGEILLFRSMDCFSGQITSEDQQIKGLDLTQVNPAAGLDRINISVEGINAEQYRDFSGHKMDYQQFVDNIAFFYDHKKVM